MSNKIKVLWMSDCSLTNNSGFSRVSLEILQRLSRNASYSVAELGINNPNGSNYKTDPAWKIYLSGGKQYCEDVFVPTVLDFEPDIVISLLDIHMNGFVNDTTQVPLEIRNSFKGIAHAPIDGAPMAQWGLDVLAGWNYIVPIHNFGYQTLQEGYTRQINKLRNECKDLLRLKLKNSNEEEIKLIDEEINIRVLYANNYARALHSMKTINHGVDLETFSPVSEEVKHDLRNELGIPQDHFVFVFFGRNSPRKQQPIVMQAFKEVLKKYPLCTLILGCKANDIGWDLAELADYLEIPHDKIYFTENNSGDSTDGLTDEQIANIYRVSDCHVSAAVGGGFELTSLESMACGLPQIAVKDAGSLTEMTKDHGILVPAQKYWLGGQHGPHERPLATPHDFANAMKELIKNSTKRDTWARAALAYARQTKFSWDFAASEFEKVIDIVMQDTSIAVEGKAHAA